MKRPITVLALAAASALALSGCAGSSPTEPGGTESDLIRVVASTNVYGSLAEQIGGDRVDVTSIITSATQDPHSYEATARDRLAVQSAVLVIENGGGYDHFMETLREGSAAHVITAVEFSHDYPGEDGHGHDDEHADDHDHDDHADDHDHDDHDDHADEDHDDHDHDHAEEEDHDHGDHEGHNHIEGFNEHVWFDVHTIVHVVEAIAEELGEIDPAGEAEFEAAASALIAELEALEDEIEDLEHEFAGAGVFLTEPLPGYLASAMGLNDLAPEGFASAVEEGSDIAPATLLAALSVIESGDVAALLTNAQTGGAETDRVEDAAESAEVPVVAFTELLEEGTSYAEWMRDAMTRLAAALRS